MFRSYRKSVMDNGWNVFTVMLEYKLADRGKALIKVPKDFPSSKMCSCCGKINNALLNDSMRACVCPVCRTAHDRDMNAAINIRDEGWCIYQASMAA